MEEISKTEIFATLQYVIKKSPYIRFTCFREDVPTDHQRLKEHEYILLFKEVSLVQIAYLETLFSRVKKEKPFNEYDWPSPLLCQDLEYYILMFIPESKRDYRIEKRLEALMSRMFRSTHNNIFLRFASAYNKLDGGYFEEKIIILPYYKGYNHTFFKYKALFSKLKENVNNTI